MGSTEDVRQKVDKLRELEDYIHEVNAIQEEDAEDVNVDDVMKEVDEGVAEDMLKELDLQNIPSTIPEQEKVMIEEKREPVLEEEQLQIVHKQWMFSLNQTECHALVF